jgi:hypothetical protein
MRTLFPIVQPDSASSGDPGAADHRLHEIVHAIPGRKVELPTRRIAGRRMGWRVGAIQQASEFIVASAGADNHSGNTACYPTTTRSHAPPAPPSSVMNSRRLM